MLINLSNHPSEKWGREQVFAASKEFGKIVDLPFPNVSPLCGPRDIVMLADETVEKVREIGAEPFVVHVMGEMTLTYTLVSKLKSLGIKCVASTTDRMVREHEDGTKEVFFQFVQFREYWANDY